MLKNLKKIDAVIYYYRDSKKIIGKHDRLSGDVSGIRGDVSGLRGDVDECGITAEERTRGIDIEQLVETIK